MATTTKKATAQAKPGTKRASVDGAADGDGAAIHADDGAAGAGAMDAPANALSAPAAACAYRVLSNLEHDMVLYVPGDEITLDDVTAAPLLGHTVEPIDAATTVE